MIKRLVFIILALLPLLGFCTEDKKEALVIIAYPEAIKLSHKSCQQFLTDPDSICLDAVVELTYGVDEVISGHYTDRMISIVDFYHSPGFPKYVIQGLVYFSLVKNKGIYFLVSTGKLIDKDDDLWICGDDLDPRVEVRKSNMLPYEPIDPKLCEQGKGVNLERLKQYFAETN